MTETSNIGLPAVTPEVMPSANNLDNEAANQVDMNAASGGGPQPIVAPAFDQSAGKNAKIATNAENLVNMQAQTEYDNKTVGGGRKRRRTTKRRSTTKRKRKCKCKHKCKCNHRRKKRGGTTKWACSS